MTSRTVSASLPHTPKVLGAAPGGTCTSWPWLLATAPTPARERGESSEPLYRFTWSRSSNPAPPHLPRKGVSRKE